jgi:hypothetical protein
MNAGIKQHWMSGWGPAPPTSVESWGMIQMGLLLIGLIMFV